jgi:hypothetical protein
VSGTTTHLEQYLAAVELGRELGAGEAYANEALGEPEDSREGEVLRSGELARRGPEDLSGSGGLSFWCPTAIKMTTARMRADRGD